MKIVLGSVLKPVNDSRVYKKIGKSLAKLPSSKIYIIGTATDHNVAEEGNITFCPIFTENQKVIDRYKANYHFFSFLKDIKADMIIVHSIELLPSILLYKFKNINCKIIYDILENYPLNFRKQGYHKKINSIFLSISAYLLEKISYRYLDHIFSAEQTYIKEKSLPSSKTTILENKYAGEISFRKNNPDITHFVMCGSLTKIFGIKQFITFVHQINHLHIDRFHFTIIGKAYEDEIINNLAQLNQELENVTVIGNENFVPHDVVINKMLEADFVCLPYPQNPSTENCIPTKMYECLALKIPMIIHQNKLWTKITSPVNAGIYCDFNKVDVVNLINQVNSYTGYRNSSKQIDPLWQSEEEKLLKVIQTL
ncbi:glycosyltransferase family protein [Flammeovirga pacifica]|uniref:Glycosyl transferase family 1 domain-containing protein n=1 Tax=Flammeovirga pacifica TaxID=915059 RepID=A0A1S1YX01_FLAPC|nr:hypothetical protein [Flammeovirga pacifica]OHX65528.1 hypothetical protein NH26_03785 [Flammeovirga pacifica]